MHGVNLDLLRTTPHHLDGTLRDPHAHHRADHLATLRAARRQRWHALVRAFVALLKRRTRSTPAIPCPEISQVGPQA